MQIAFRLRRLEERYRAALAAAASACLPSTTNATATAIRRSAQVWRTRQEQILGCFKRQLTA